MAIDKVKSDPKRTVEPGQKILALRDQHNLRLTDDLFVFVRWSSGEFSKVPTGYNTPQPPTRHTATSISGFLDNFHPDVQRAMRQRLHHAIPWVDTAVAIA